MTSTTPSNGLFSSPITFFREDRFSWCRNAPCVAAVKFQLTGGLRFSENPVPIEVAVDAAFPDRLLSISVPVSPDQTEVQSRVSAYPGDGDPVTKSQLGPLAGVIGSIGIAAWQEFARSGDDSALRQFRFSDPWARRFEVESVNVLRPAPLSSGALALDEALAATRTKDSGAAQQSLLLGVEAISSLAEDCADDRAATPEFLVNALETALAEVLQDSPDFLREELMEAQEFFDDRSTFDDLDLELFRHSSRIFDNTVSRDGLAVHAGGGDPGAPVIERFVIDPQTVTPRVIRWNGAAAGELHVRTSGPYEAGAAMTSTVYLDVYDSAWAAGALTAYVADRTTGRILRTGRLTLDPADNADGRISTSLNYTFPQSTDLGEPRLHFGISELLGTHPPARTTTIGLKLVMADRWALDAWHSRREAATAAQLARSLAEFAETANETRIELQDIAEDLSFDAENRARQANLELEGAASMLEQSGAPGTIELAGAVRERAQIWASAFSDAPAPIPLLSELESMIRRAG